MTTTWKISEPLLEHFRDGRAEALRHWQLRGAQHLAQQIRAYSVFTNKRLDELSFIDPNTWHALGYIDTAARFLAEEVTDGGEDQEGGA